MPGRDAQSAPPRVVFACDELYAMPLATALRSIVESGRGPWPHRFTIISNGFSPPARARVLASLPAGSAEISWIGIGLDDFRGLATVPGVTPMTFARLLIPRVLPSDIRRVLYLDTDVLVRDDLTALWQTDLGGAAAGAVLDHLDAPVKRGERQIPGMARVRHYFNAGVLVIDLEKWREARISEKALEYLRAHPRSPYMDQDGLNAALDGLWTRLDARWNFQDHYATDIAALHGAERPAIVHFVTRLKPWLATSLSPNHSLYDDVRRRTAYARPLPEVLRDALVTAWYGTKRALRQYRVVRRLERRLRPGTARQWSES